MTNHQQVCAITTEAVYKAVLAEDGRLWERWSSGTDRLAGFAFNNRKCPMDTAIRLNEHNGIATYLDRVH